MTQPTRTRVRHGMASCHRYGCPRPECRDASLRARRSSQADLRQGVRARVDVAPAMRHGRALVRAGMPAHDIAARTGLSPTTVTNVLNGRRSKIFRDTAEAILALPMPRRGYRSPAEGWIDATAARRRLQALSALGFTLPLLAAQVGVTEETIGAIRQRRRKVLRVSLDQAVAAAYDRLWRADPLALGGTPSGVARAKAWAVKQRWAPPAAWDDDQIADVRARPKGVPRRPRTAPAASSAA